MAPSGAQLRRQLLDAGVANAAINAVWPQWWSEEANSSLSATAELTYTVARRLGMSPRALFDGSTQFLWLDSTKFKNLGTTTESDRAILASFGTAVGRCALKATAAASISILPDVLTLRRIILDNAKFVDVAELLKLCWSLGIPVIQLRVFPLPQKRMQAMTVNAGGRYAILIGFESGYYARTAYIIAHELSHIILGHLGETESLLDMDDTLEKPDIDDEESDADRSALLLLTGTERLDVAADTSNFSSTQLAQAALRESEQLRIEPGILALCLGHTTNEWQKVYGALKIIPPGVQDVGNQINRLAANQLDWSALSYSNREYLTGIMGINGESAS